MTVSAGPLLTKVEARRYLGGISEKTLDRYVASGRLRAVRLDPGRFAKVYFTPTDLDGFIEASRTYRVEDAS